MIAIVLIWTPLCQLLGRMYTVKHEPVNLWTFCPNTRDRYKTTALILLGRKDHNLVLLIPIPVPVVQTLPAVASGKLQGLLQHCRLRTTSTYYIDYITEYINYIQFCKHVTIPTRTVNYFPDNKPWITQMNEKKTV